MTTESEPEHGEWVRRIREIARQDASELVPRPQFAVLGLSEPVLRPAALLEAGQVNGVWETVTIAYGDWSAQPGPLVTVTTTARPGQGPRQEAAAEDAVWRDIEDQLLCAIDGQRDRVAFLAGVDEKEPDGPPGYTREALPSGDALVCRHGDRWAARMLTGAGIRADVSVTMVGCGVDPGSVIIGPAVDLQACFDARNELLGQVRERRKNLPPPVLDPAEGVAALRALADYTLEEGARIRAAARERRAPRQLADGRRVRHALWQRAVSEQQRVAGTGRHAADDMVALVINHLGHLDEEASWFADPRLREMAIDETLRYAMLGQDVASKPAQQAWATYWGVRLERWRREPGPGDIGADMAEDHTIATAWRDAWAAWARGAGGRRA